jgi:hypothetical protein
MIEQACKPIKLQELIEEYISKNGRRLKWSTQSWSRQSWQRFIESIGDKQVIQVTRNDAEDFIESLYEADLSVNSVKSYPLLKAPA